MKKATVKNNYPEDRKIEEEKKVERKLNAVRKTEKEIQQELERERQRKVAGEKLQREREKWMVKSGNKKRGHVVQDEVDLYVRQLLDPFTTMSAVVPDVHAYPTTTFSVKTPITITTNSDGRFCIMIRDGLTFHYMLSDYTGYTDGLKYSAGNGWYIGVTGGSVWNSGSEVASIRGTFSAYRPVAMGVRIAYDAAPVDAAGRIAMGYFPGTQTLPFESNSDTTYYLPYEDYANYMNVITGSAISGGTVVWRPMTPQNHFRPTKAYFYNGSTDVFAEMVYTNNVLTAQGATWDIDPEVCPAMQGLGLYEDEATALVSVAASAARLNIVSTPLNTPVLCIMGEGLPADTQVFAGEIVAHYEGVADNRGFSLVQPVQRVAKPGSFEKAIHRASKVHPAHSGGSIPSHQSWLNQALQVTQTVAGVANTVSGIVNNVPRVVEPLLEAAETVAALF